MNVAVGTLQYREPGKVPSVVLAVVVHVLLAVFLFFGVRWQSSQPEAVMVELWNNLPAPVTETPQPRPEIKPEPKPEPKPEVKRAPEVEAPKPDIALEKKEEAKKEPPKKEPKEAPKKEAPKLDLDRSKDIRAEVEREATALERARILDQMKRDGAALSSKARATWIGAIVGKIKPNVVAQPNIPGNPEAIFDVTLLPTGDVLSVRLRKSSGFKSYDEALERAILKSSPLPKPDRPELFERSLVLKFRPLD